MGMGGQYHAPAALPPGKGRNPVKRAKMARINYGQLEKTVTATGACHRYTASVSCKEWTVRDLKEACVTYFVLALITCIATDIYQVEGGKLRKQSGRRSNK